MHFIVRQPFRYGGVSYIEGDGLYGSDYSSLSQDINYSYYSFFVVTVSDSAPHVSNGGGSTSGGTPDMPFATGYYSIPGGASTSGVFSNQPVRLLSIRNTSPLPQGALVNLWDCATTGGIPTAHLIGSYQLGPTQAEPVQILTQVGLCWSISQGDGSGATTDNQQGIALNSVGSVDLDFAAV